MKSLKYLKAKKGTLKTMDKYIEVKFSDGKVFAVPAILIAQDRADYYLRRDVNDMKGEVSEEQMNEMLREEIDFALDNDFELIDWFENNMLWSEVEDEVRLLKEEVVVVDREREYVNAPKKVLESEQTLIKIEGEPFRCELCRANVFTRIGDRYFCNGCNTRYLGEK